VWIYYIYIRVVVMVVAPTHFVVGVNAVSWEFAKIP
jgi:hypothetical protein